MIATMIHRPGFLLLFLFLLPAALPTPGSEARSPHSRPAVVEVAKVVSKPIATTLSLNGTVRPRFETSVSTEVSGKIEKVFVEEGDRVNPKDLLARIDPERYTALLKAAAAEKKRTAGNLNRGRLLFEEGFLPREELERREAEADAAEAAWELARIDRKKSRVTAPFRGIITRRFVDPGVWLDRGDPIVEVSDLSVVHIIVPLPEKYLQKIAVGRSATLTVDAIPGREFPGRVKAVIPKADEGKNYPVKIVVDNPDLLLKNGMFTRVRLFLQAPFRVLMVPKDAVVHRTKGDAVFLVRDQKVRRIAVQTGREQGTFIEVAGELKAGDPVVVTGNEDLRNGQAVRIVQHPAKTE